MIELPGDARQVLDRAASELASASATTSSRATGRRCSARTTRRGSRRSWPPSRTSHHPERARAPIRVAFTVDEEVGRAPRTSISTLSGADVAYTLDGSGLGELEVETFSARSMRVTIRGYPFIQARRRGS
jgi:hypothetical protein